MGFCHGLSVVTADRYLGEPFDTQRRNQVADFGNCGNRPAVSHKTLKMRLDMIYPQTITKWRFTFRSGLRIRNQEGRA